MKLHCAFFYVFTLGITFAFPMANGQDFTLEQVETRIAELEATLRQAQADRFRQKNRLEYDDEQAAPIYQEAKTLEKQRLDLRLELENRLRASDATIRTMERDVARLHQEATEKSNTALALRREAHALPNTGGPAEDVANRVADLEREAVALDVEGAGLREKAITTARELAERRLTVAAETPATATMSARLAELDEAYRQVFGRLHQTLDVTTSLEALDQRRQAIGAELQELRELRARLLAETAGE